MILTDTQKQDIKQQVVKIEVMGVNELRAYVQNLYMSKSAMEAVVFNWILGAADLRMAVLMEKVSPMAVSAELDLD